MAEPLVSVIVTTYNREEYLKETLNSILAQTYKDFELIVVDNFSNYDFYKMIDGVGDPRIRPYQNHNNGIIAVNRNFGIKQAKGKYLAFCDDDDIWCVDKLEKQVLLIEKTGCDLCYTNAIFFNEDTHCEEKINKRNYNGFRDLMWNNQIILSSVLVKNTPDILFNENSCVVTSEDYYLWLELSIKHYKAVLLEDYVLRYRISSNSLLRKDYKKSYLICAIVFIDLLIKYPNIKWGAAVCRVATLLFKYSLKNILK